MDEKQAEELLEDVLDEAVLEGKLPELARIETFEDAGVLTMSRGLVLHMADGSEFQLMLVRSR